AIPHPPRRFAGPRAAGPRAVRLIAHISDLHFGRHDPLIASGLLADLAAEKPDLVAVSGDLTQRAHHHEFVAARDLLDRIGEPFRVLAAHDPLLPPPVAPDRGVVGRAGHALHPVADSGVDLLLTGHYHRASSRNVTSCRLAAKRTVLVSQAGTAISTRRRGE